MFIIDTTTNLKKIFYLVRFQIYFSLTNYKSIFAAKTILFCQSFLEIYVWK